MANSFKMGPRVIDITGQVFARLTVLSYAGSVRKRTRWQCQCSCGNVIVVEGSGLKNGHSQSCGCLKIDLVKNRSTVHGYAPRGKRNPEYQAFHGAKSRCNSLTNKQYAEYGGRGIEFRFLSFSDLLDEVGPRPDPTFSLDRIDNDGHYEKGNVRWASKAQQSNNQRRNRRLAVAGALYTAAEAARQFGVNAKVIRGRFGLGWCDDCIIHLPRHARCRHLTTKI